MEDSHNACYFLLGIGIGASIGILFAPKAGSETRELLQAKSQEGMDALQRQGQDLHDLAVETIERGKQRVQSQMKNLANAFAAGKRAFHETIKQARAA